MISGVAWVFGDDLNTDVIHPPEYFSLDPERVRQGLFAKYDSTMVSRLRKGDVLVAGRNFGCGSSRETSIRSLLLNGVGAVIAVDFARIFFRSATNNGLPCLTFADPADLARVPNGGRVSVLPDQGLLSTIDGRHIPLEPPGRFVRRIWAAGGLLGLLPAR
ncbi:MAG TPA: 3-isopropylmalate dehydratase [Actinophytocola sp.]|jgi:3-isopropylmalate dehydratase small subunit|uniref:LeuD/DmdB family oxidoreductase small subunit n=1 Tax=Actinophytocola sp. TaxID=1872138 RepID=UPI002E079717|nr:3-isopropylmalate dehydratase [Actinophytocola sp.]